MSNYHSYHCLDCNESFKPSNLNNREEQLIVSLKFKREIVALVPLASDPHVWGFDLSLGLGHSVPIEFFAKHLEHSMVVLSEYRDHYYLPSGDRVDKGVPY